MNDLNELSDATESGTLTVAGAAGEFSGHYGYIPGVTNVVVNGETADLYADGTFAAAGFTPANGQNTYTAIAQDNIGRLSTNSVTVNVVANAGYTYDLNGNLTSDGSRNLAYDDENQLVAVWVANAWSNSFAYDGFLRKRIEQQFAWNGSGWTETNEVHYIYDGNLVLQERDGNNEPLTTYTRGVDLSGTRDGAGGIGGLLARSDNQKIVPAILTPEYPNPQNVVTSYYFSDGQGNVKALVSPSGMLLAQYEYDPFGNLLSENGLMADINKYRFSSKEWDENAGLYYYGYRFYDPNLQRWLSRDPLQELGGINLYRFSINDPLGWIDPFGLDKIVVYRGGMPIVLDNNPTPYQTSPQLGQDVWGNHLPNEGDLMMDIYAEDYAAMLASEAGGEGLGALGTVAPRLGKIAQTVCKFRGPEYGRWKNAGQWQEGWHFHVGEGSGLDTHHLPQQTGNWWKNFKAFVSRVWNGD